MKGTRPSIYYYFPTPQYLRSCVPPLEKKKILAWYEQEKKILDLRLKKPVTRTIEYTTVVVDRETKTPIKKSTKSSKQKIEKWKLSKQDRDMYRTWLDARFEKLKAEYNQKILDKRKERKDG